MRVCSECGGDCDPHVDSRQRTALQEAVLRAAVKATLASRIHPDADGDKKVHDALNTMDDAVDALLAAEPAWGDT